MFDPRGKFRPNWAGPYVIKTMFSEGAAKLMDMDGKSYSNWLILIACVSITCDKKNKNK